MQKDKSYHEAAILYNEELANFAQELSDRLEHEEIKRWCVSVAKQHRFHATRHKAALGKLEAKLSTDDEIEPVVDQVLHPDDLGAQRKTDEEQIVHRSAESGQFVTEEFAQENPATTVQETIEEDDSEEAAVETLEHTHISGGVFKNCPACGTTPEQLAAAASPKAETSNEEATA